MRTQFESSNAAALAMNRASVASHERHATKMGFGFPILSDPDRATAGAYKCQKSTGKGVIRALYALGPDGKVIFAERGHADLKSVLALIKSRRS